MLFVKCKKKKSLVLTFEPSSFDSSDFPSRSITSCLQTIDKDLGSCDTWQSQNQMTFTTIGWLRIHVSRAYISREHPTDALSRILLIIQTKSFHFSTSQISDPLVLTKKWHFNATRSPVTNPAIQVKSNPCCHFHLPISFHHLEIPVV